jgi:hypothetical protein
MPKGLAILLFNAAASLLLAGVGLLALCALDILLRWWSHL